MPSEKNKLENAIAAAEVAYSAMKSLPHHVVASALEKIKKYVEDRAEEFAFSIASEALKPIRAARQEVERTLHTIDEGAKYCGSERGFTLNMDQRSWGENRFALVERFPIGVVGAITPFNFPLNLVAHKIIPALVARNTIVLKPASKTPTPALMLAQAVAETDLPVGAASVVPCSAQTAAVLADDPRIKLLTFTGSGSVGWELKKRASKKKTCLECGGNAAVVVHRDADIEKAATLCASGGFSYAGQSCISVQRIFVQRDVEKQFAKILVEKVSRLVVGDPMSEATDVGPMISENEAIRAESWIREAQAQGAKILLGGTRNGATLSPTILSDTSPAMKVMCDEIFAPVVCLVSYSDFEDALARVNDSPFGLQTGLFTSDFGRIHQAYQTLDVGGLIVNDVPTWRIDHMPYGGNKDSGNTREGIRFSVEEQTVPKLLTIRLK
jgi:acyl-CoA reductase-like NAD-dependent aldehyde dehydrogenase